MFIKILYLIIPVNSIQIKKFLSIFVKNIICFLLAKTKRTNILRCLRLHFPRRIGTVDDFLATVFFYNTNRLFFINKINGKRRVE